MKALHVLCGVAVSALLSASPVAAMDLAARASTQARKVRSNEPTRVFRSWYINEDCEPLRGFEVAIEQAPANGTVRLQKVTEKIDQSWLGNSPGRGRIRRIANCTGKETQSIHVLYQSSRNYVGRDQFVFSITSAEKVQKRLVTIDLQVR